LPAVKAKSPELASGSKDGAAAANTLAQAQGIIPFVSSGLSFRLPLFSLPASAHFFYCEPFLDSDSGAVAAVISPVSAVCVHNEQNRTLCIAESYCFVQPIFFCVLGRIVLALLCTFGTIV
jgi:hypothetical protein